MRWLRLFNPFRHLRLEREVAEAFDELQSVIGDAPGRREAS